MENQKLLEILNLNQFNLKLSEKSGAFGTEQKYLRVKKLENERLWPIFKGKR